tara:strand:- start:3164 stop:4060 length:897 start_codon:yes stop_codon:yes gene_type:complete
MNKKKEKGFALILSLVLLLVMSLMGGSLIVIASGDHRNNNTSDQYQQTFYVAETALMEGEKWLTDNYLGHWINSTPDWTSTVIEPWAERCRPFIKAKAKCEPEPTEDEKNEYDLLIAQNKIDFKSHIGGYTTFANGLVRHTWGKGPIFNDVSLTNEKKNICMQSFKNIKAGEAIKIAYTLPPDHKRLGSFWNIIAPIVSETYLHEHKDSSLGFSAIQKSRALEQEEAYLRRFKYTFFIQHIGYSNYRGTGTSIQRSTAVDVAQQGSAYKIYGCGLLYDKNATKIQIIVPLETMVVMPY